MKERSRRDPCLKDVLWLGFGSAGLQARTSPSSQPTISVSQIDDQVAKYALSPAVLPSLVDRNLTLARHNAKLVKEFIGRDKAVCSWAEPTGGTTSFVRFIKNGQPINDVNFCLDLLSKNNDLFGAGSKCFGNDEDFKGYIRMGYVCETHVLVKGLKRLGTYIDANLL